MVVSTSILFWALLAMMPLLGGCFLSKSCDMLRTFHAFIRTLTEAASEIIYIKRAAKLLETSSYSVHAS